MTPIGVYSKSWYCNKAEEFSIIWLIPCRRLESRAILLIFPCVDWMFCMAEAVMSDSCGEFGLQALTSKRVTWRRWTSGYPGKEVSWVLWQWLKRHALPVDGRRSLGDDAPVSSAETDRGMPGYGNGCDIPEDGAANGGLLIRRYGGDTSAFMCLLSAFEESFTYFC
jgi:hypothetical protein